MTRENGMLQVSSTVRSPDGTVNTIDDESTKLETVVFPEGVEPATVSLGVGMTLNLGDYRSLRIDVHISKPCYAEETESKLKNEIEPEVEKYLDYYVKKSTEFLAGMNK